MKIDVLLASLISVFFLGKATKDVEEKTQLASKMRTIVYLVLTIVVGIFYYKTQQVATIYNYIFIEGHRATRDTLKHCVDTISGIRIVNHFSSAGINDNTIIDNFQDKDVLDKGGIQVKIGSHIGDEYTYETKKDKENSIYYKSPYNNLGIVYELFSVSTKVPSLFPFFFTYEHNSPQIFTEFSEIEYGYYDLNKNPDLVKYYKINNLIGKEYPDEIIPAPFSNAFVTTAKLRVDKDVTDKVKKDNHTINLLVTCLSKEQNFFNIFTAADISQYVSHVSITSSAHVRALEICHDTPIRANSFDSCVHVGSYSIRIEGKLLEEQMKNMAIHVELPTLANLQLLRSLILTTLLTALISLFFCNVYYLARRKILKCKEDYVESINKDKLKRLMVFIYFLSALIIWAVFRYIWVLIKNRPINVPSDWFVYYIILFIVIVLITFIYIINRIKRIITFKKQKPHERK